MNRTKNKVTSIQNDMNCEKCINDKCLIKKSCAPKWISIINEKKNNIKCNSGKSIILEGTPVMGIYFIYKGKVKITVTGENNKEHIVRLANDSHVVGHMAYGFENYPLGATALDDCNICFIDNKTLNELLLDSPTFAITMMHFYASELRKAEIRIKYISQMTVREKVIYSLVYLIETFGLTKENMLDVEISRQEVAEIAGTTAEQVSREISVLTKEKIITTQKKRIIINSYKKLQEFVKTYFPYNAD